SYWGRVASLAAAAPDHDFAGLLLLAYPLHRPGFPEQLRTEHWPRVRCPVLIVQGGSDPFGSPDEVRREARKLREVRVVTLPGTGHGLKERLDDALAAAADWIAGLGGSACGPSERRGRGDRPAPQVANITIVSEPAAPAATVRGANWFGAVLAPVAVGRRAGA